MLLNYISSSTTDAASLTSTNTRIGPIELEIFPLIEYYSRTIVVVGQYRR